MASSRGVRVVVLKDDSAPPLLRATVTEIRTLLRDAIPLKGCSSTATRRQT